MSKKKPKQEAIALSPEDQASFIEAILDPPPLAPVMERPFERLAELADLWKSADVGPKTHGVMSFEELDAAKGTRGSEIQGAQKKRKQNKVRRGR